MFVLSWRMTMRDWRAGELRFLIVALMIAVASLSSVGFFTDRMRNGLNRDAHQLLGADLLISADQPISGDWREQARQRGLQMAETVVFPSMAIAGEGEQAAARLVSLKAVSHHYPLRGNLQLQPPGMTTGTGVATKDIPASGTVWLDPALQLALNLRPGDPIRLGDKTFRFTRVIANEPDRGAGFMNFAPRVMIAMDDLAATGLVQDGSRVTYRLLLAGAPEKIKTYQDTLQQAIAQQQIKGIRLESLESGRPEMRAALDRAEQFLSLVSLLSAMLAAVAIAMAARRFMLRHLDACAMLRCLGLTQNQVLQIYLTEFLILGIVGSLSGILLGYAGHYVLLEWLGKLVAKDLPAASLLPALQGLLTGLLLLLGFALPPVLQLRNVPHNRVIRREQDVPQPLTVATYVLGLLMFVGLLLWQTGDLRIGLLISAAFVAGIAVFALIAWFCVLSLKRMRNLFSAAAWRFAINALQRRPGATILQIVALALGLMALLLLTLVRGDLMTAWQQATPADAPNQFVINIQQDQKDLIRQRLSAFGQPRMYPMIRGRLIEVNQRAISQETYQEDQARRLVDREFNLSTMNDMPEMNSIVAGQWYDDSHAAEPEASVEEGIAKTLRLKLGDQLTFDVAGQQVSARITSLRKLDWSSMRVNFFVIINPAAMRQMPQTWITAFHLPATDQVFVNRLTQDFPNLTVVDVGIMIRQVQDVLNQVMTAVEFLFLFTLASGVLVLYAALAGSQDIRMREAALLRALGATRSQLSHAQWVEFLLTGGLAGLLAASGASAIGWALARYSFHFDWHFSALVWVTGLVAGGVCAVIGGWVGLRQVLKQPPLLSLRNA
ncbi:ABC transporter permease [Undibacterium oligocarboniphilum]|uniref:FtsX-like permease family protein n=1 Tax=Undibacterium oligocarboniphilum TaxID=666702 RepID=A0A850QPP5_9BURK|nr:FtsX-like permease family protein [Undibacterium oligocarboniphilum]MBC3870065.1 FtsX-like permease family protein [Undibacterium oligocarboniphilum]NVO78056.1 FtsX-like permease family protein [Undibacterium oligocarboniphilum]